MKGARMVLQGVGTGVLVISAIGFFATKQPSIGLLAIGLTLLLNSIFLGQEM